jgi:hypothetical protein
MLDIAAARLLDWYSIALLLTIVGSIFSVVSLMQQEQRNTDVQNRSVIGLVSLALTKAPEGKFSVLVLMGSGYFLYCKVLGLSKYDLSPISLLLHFGGSVFAMLLLSCAAVISRWIDFDNSEQ